MIISSQENRSIQTAKIIQELNPVHHIISSNLNEIKFRRGIIEKEDIEQEDFHYLRKKILTSIYNSNFSEKFYDVKNRFLKFLEFTKTIEHDNILCVTHGWFMRIIELYKEKGSLENINLNELLEVRPAKFLDTIEIHPL
ncbi:MAG: phosphoglycerate mutase family protein [Nanoarchaeota archaeon]|nr:phosphoglycerate mutase family protein [Nanoarchaeota archaeon]